MLDTEKLLKIARLALEINTMKTEELLNRIQDYLSNGGLFNPELMEPDKVRALLLDCRDHIQAEPRTSKPPLGVMPRAIWIEKHRQELSRAIQEH
jgi:hypothetical protein